MFYSRWAVLSATLACGLSLTTRASECPWPVVGAGRVYVDVGCTNAVSLLDGTGGLVRVYRPGIGVGEYWHLLSPGSYSISVSGIADSPFVVGDGATVGVSVAVNGAVSVWNVANDTPAEATSFWTGFTFVFGVGMIGLGGRWFSRLAVDNGFNE